MHTKTERIKEAIEEEKKVHNFLIRNKLFVILVLVGIAGFIVGSLVFKSSSGNFYEKAIDLVKCNFGVRASGSFFDLFSESIFSSFVFILVIFLMGLSAWGVTLVPPIVFLKTYCLSIYCKSVYYIGQIKGIFFLILVVLPGFLVSILATILMSKEAIKISNIFSNILLNVNTQQNDEKHVKLYLLKTGCVLILTVFSAFLDAVFNLIFYRFFSF